MNLEEAYSIEKAIANVTHELFELDIHTAYFVGDVSPIINCLGARYHNAPEVEGHTGFVVHGVNMYFQDAF